jgi:hypothetical protein
MSPVTGYIIRSIATGLFVGNGVLLAASATTDVTTHTALYKYKKCSVCGKIKLANERYFRKRNDNKGDGFRNECRICEKMNKSGENLL